MTLLHRESAGGAEFVGGGVVDGIMGNEDGGPGGEYTEYISHLRALAAGAVSDIKERVSQCVFKDERDRLYVLRLIDGGEFQMLSEAGMRKGIIRELRERRMLLLKALPRWRDLTDEELSELPSTRQAARQELDKVETRLGELQERESGAIRDGSKYDSLKLIEFLSLSEERRRGQSYSHLLPPELRRAETVMAGYVNQGAAWFVHNQSIGAQMLTGAAMGRQIGYEDYAMMQGGSKGRRATERFRRRDPRGSDDAE